MNNLSPAQTKRLVMILISLSDTVLGGLVLLVYFGYLPFDIASLGVPRWVVGALGAVWFFSGLGILAYQVSKNIEES